MKSSEEMIKSLFDRRERYEKEKTERRKKVLKTAVPVLVCCVVLASGLAFWRFGSSGGIVSGDPSGSSAAEPGSSSVSSGEGAPAPAVIWADENSVCQFVEGLTPWGPYDVVGMSLAASLDAGKEDDVFAILARPFIDYEFVYEGQTLAKYYAEAAYERNLPEILSQLLKEGDELKYGTALYEGGLPDGVTGWSKEWYEERTAWYGEELLEQYLKDGAFLKDELEADRIAAEQATSASDACDEAFTAYLTKVAASVGGRIPAEVRPEENGIVLFLTREEFRNFSADHLEAWSFDLAFRDGGDETFAAGE